MGRIVVFLCTAKGFGVSLGLGPGTGFLGSEPMMDESSMRVLLLESVRGLKRRRPLIIPGSSSTWVAITAPAWLSTVCSGALVSVATAG